MIDIHTHFVPEQLPALPARSSEPTWPSMCPGRDCHHRHVMVKGDVYRVVTDQCWSAPRRIEDMAAMGVTRQVLSPMPELLSYWMKAADAAVLHRDINEQMARLVQSHPDQFHALAAVPLQDVDAAITELTYAHQVLRFSGAEIGSNVNGRPIGAPEFRPFFEAAQRLGMAVFVHALRPPGKERLLGPPSPWRRPAFSGAFPQSSPSLARSFQRRLPPRCTPETGSRSPIQVSGAVRTVSGLRILDLRAA